jgi:YVTN family beta-propeller protein
VQKRLDFRILGPLEVRAEGVPLPLGGPRQRALLALLLLSANRVVSRDRLLEELVGARTGDAAHHTLSVQVSRLRRSIQPDGLTESRLVTCAPGYSLRVGPGELDLHRFEELVGEGRQALEENDPEQAVMRFRAAESLWRGRPLADIEFERFAQIEVERLEELRLGTLEERIQAELALGRHATLVPELERLAAEHPLRERFRGQLMLALYRAGRQADALEAYRLGRALLSEELALDPSPPLKELEQAILRQDAALELPRSAPAFPQAAEPLAVADARAAEPAPPWRARGLRWAGIATAGALVLGLVGFFTTEGGGSERSGFVSGDAIALVSPVSGRISAVVPLAASPSDTVEGFGSLWVTQYGAETVTRVDLRTRSVTQTIRVGHGPTGVATAAGAVWVANTLDGTVSRIDPKTDTVVETTSVGHQPSGLIVAGGSLWVSNRGDSTASRLDPGSGRVDAVVPVGAGPTGLAATRDALWVSSEDAGTVTRIQPHTATVVNTIHVGDAPAAIAAAREGVWVLDRLDSTLSRIDAATDTVAATVPTGGTPAALAVVDGRVWVTNETSGELARLDPNRLTLAHVTRIGGRLGALTASPDGLWVGVAATGARHRGGTMRVVTAIGGVPSTDPASAAEISPVQLLGLSNDGLVTFDHVAGPDGARIVPDLALFLPAPGDGGRTYTFRLRRAIRYSTGGVVMPTDVRSSFERLFDVRSPGMDFYDQIVGAAACESHRPCHLSDGIIADDREGTVTFRLTRPDPDFLYKLAQQYAFVVPASTPHRLLSSPIPATGPYVIATYAPGRELHLVRNPVFREWSAAAQPDGYPDRIDWNFTATPTQAVKMVEQGSADLMTNIGAPPPSTREELQLRFPGLLRTHPETGTDFWALNTRARPFDDVRVRRAVNYAVDRRVVANIYGGSEAAEPTCQLLPPPIPGYRRYCPYTRSPSLTGRWLRSDLDRARRLVAASGTRGMKVTVWDTPQPRAVADEGRYLASVLRRLGYRASVRFLDDPQIFEYTNDSHTHAQVITGGWSADYPSASDFIGKLTCDSFTPGVARSTIDSSELCDPALDREIARAEALQVTHPSAATNAWARLDRKLTNLAIWVPTVTTKDTDVVSSRAGDYQYHLLWGAMYDQIWVR